MKPFPYRIERLNDERLPDVQRLLRQVLKKKVSLDYVRKKYDTRHTGHQYMSSIAYDGDQPIAFYGTIPQVFLQDGKRFVGCHVSDSMTLEAYQRRGLHQQLALRCYEWMREEGVSVVYGFHSENTYHSCKKLDWKEWGNLRGYWVPTDGLPFARIFRRIPILRSLHTAYVRQKLKPLQIPPSFLSNSNAQSGISVEYSPAYYASKAFHHNYLIAIEGVKFWLAMDAVVRVGDVHFESTEQLNHALKHLQKICRKLGHDRILFQTYPDSKLDRALWTHYTGFESWIVGYLDLQPDFDFRAYRPNYADQDSF
jgi:GNAT superfamily N-acetyltransferase